MEPSDQQECQWTEIGDYCDCSRCLQNKANRQKHTSSSETRLMGGMSRMEDLDTLTEDTYGFLYGLIEEMPDTWIPDLVARLVNVGYERGIWRKDDGASKFIGLVENKRRLNVKQD